MDALTIIIILQVLLLLLLGALYWQRNQQQSSWQQLGQMLASNNQQLTQLQTNSINQSLTNMDRKLNAQLEQVYKGLGAMQSMAASVGDLQKVLSNVKTRGILGEYQLGAILSEILAPEQYEMNIATKKGSRDVVEFAVKLPVEGGAYVYLPIDSKFPGETYGYLRDAYESGDTQEIASCLKALLTTVRAEARDIHDKYLDPPHTTDFALLFLPFEGLYAEVVNHGMVEILQRDYQVNIVGPSTMAALLNSIQMSFRTIAIQKRSGEVWETLGAVKTEFAKFSASLELTRNRLAQATTELDKLATTRTRKLELKLKNITALTEESTQATLEEEDS